jgi:hypothetical protein
VNKKIKVYMGIPTTGVVCDTQPYLLRELQQKYGDRIEFVYPEVCVRRIFHDFARNEIVKEFLATDCDVLWFLDSDIAPSRHVLDLITEHWDKWKVAGAPYPVFMTPTGYDNPQVLFCVYKGTDGEGLRPSAIPYSGTDFVDGLATGCLFIKREIFEQMEEPYFEFKYDQKSRIMTEGEDIGFCKKVLKQGYRFFTDYSMVCKHYKTICLLEMNNYAIDYANRAVKNYDAQVRDKVEALVSRIRAQAAPKEPEAPKSSLILPKHVLDSLAK